MTCLHDFIAFQCVVFRPLGHFQLWFSCQTAALLTSSPDAELRFQGEGRHEKRHNFAMEKCHVSCHDRRDGADSGGKARFAWCLGFGFSLHTLRPFLTS